MYGMASGVRRQASGVRRQATGPWRQAEYCVGLKYEAEQVDFVNYSWRFFFVDIVASHLIWLLI